MCLKIGTSEEFEENMLISLCRPYVALKLALISHPPYRYEHGHIHALHLARHQFLGHPLRLTVNATPHGDSGRVDSGPD